MLTESYNEAREADKLQFQYQNQSKISVFSVDF